MSQSLLISSSWKDEGDGGSLASSESLKLQGFIAKCIKAEGKTDPNKQASLTNRSEAMSNRCKSAMAIHLT